MSEAAADRAKFDVYPAHDGRRMARLRVLDERGFPAWGVTLFSGPDGTGVLSVDADVYLTLQARSIPALAARWRVIRDACGDEGPTEADVLGGFARCRAALDAADAAEAQQEPALV